MTHIGVDIQKATALLKAGELVAIPTETVYGLAANALDAEAVAKIFEVKRRPSFDPLIVHLPDLGLLDSLCTAVPDTFFKLYEKLSPGPITYILPKTNAIPDLVTAGNNTVGIRFPKHPLTRDLLLQSKLPLAAPSANPFGYISPTSAQHVNEQLGAFIPYILDGGPSIVGLESTIIDLSNAEPVILRLGGMALEEIEEALEAPIQHIKTSSSNPQAPGMLSSHYAPRKPLLYGNMQGHIKITRGKKVGIITFCKRVSNAPEARQLVLSPQGDLREAASKLFAAMRSLDQSDVELIVAEEFPNEGLGLAINDRLQRAAFRE
jgi:L-threonylcarbamoyladenylate synthase